ncbi:MAG: glycyl-radical enzyme activating protein [Desulfomicrobium apsheronum]|nr:glycyl-radical enzyme activating protein [Desulfomicrobium apsheronum]
MPSAPSPSGTLFAIKRYALHDGPDLRVTIFLKGCPLSCLWCHNPEGIKAAPAILALPKKCVGCGECMQACPQGALRPGPVGVIRNSEICTVCGTCAEVCPALAHEAVGRTWTVSEAMTEIEKEIPFFAGNGGGVTFSGGEPLAQPDFLEALLVACGNLDLHRAVDTSGFATAETISRIARHTDLFLFDIKHMDPDTHRRVTGVSNAPILANLRLLAELGARIGLRLPLIPGINDDAENIRRTGLLAASLPGIRDIAVLPYHASARGKYAKLGMSYPGAAIKQSDPDSVDRAVDILQHCGLEVRIGG